MMEYIHFEEFKIRHNEAGPDGRLRTQAFFDYMQEAAANNAEELGFGLSMLREKNMLWVLSRMRLRILDHPGIGDTVLLKTYPSGLDRLFALRQFQLTSKLTGKVFAEASSFWLILNGENFRPISPKTAIEGEFPDNTAEPIYFTEAGKLKKEQTAEPFELTVLQSEIDVNRHLNNSYYAAFAHDWISAKQSSFTHIDEIQVNFNTSMPFGAKLVCSGALHENQFYVEGTTDAGANAFQAAGTFHAIQ